MECLTPDKENMLNLTQLNKVKLKFVVGDVIFGADYDGDDEARLRWIAGLDSR